MPKRRIIKASDLSGLWIYQDPKRGTIYYDILSRKGYILTTSDVQKYTLYTALLPLSVIVAVMFMSLFNLNYITTALIFAAVYIVGAIFFRFWFFYKLPVAEKWNRAKRESVFVYMARAYTKTRLIILIVLSLLLTITMPLYGVIEQYSGLNLYASYAAGGLAFAGMVICLVALILKNKYNY